MFLKEVSPRLQLFEQKYISYILKYYYNFKKWYMSIYCTYEYIYFKNWIMTTENLALQSQS